MVGYLFLTGMFSESIAVNLSIRLRNKLEILSNEPFTSQSQLLIILKKKPAENIVSARMCLCGIPANKLGFPHISKHGMPDLALKNHITICPYTTTPGCKSVWDKTALRTKINERNHDWLSVFNPAVPYRLWNAQNHS